jgi:hypothetical protein
LSLDICSIKAICSSAAWLSVLAGDIDCLAEFARASSQGVNDYDDEGQAPLHVAADKGISEAISILTGDSSSSNGGSSSSSSGRSGSSSSGRSGSRVDVA